MLLVSLECGVDRGGLILGDRYYSGMYDSRLGLAREAEWHNFDVIVTATLSSAAKTVGAREVINHLVVSTCRQAGSSGLPIVPMNSKEGATLSY